MKKHEYLNTNKFLVLLNGLVLPNVGHASFWQDELQIHGFVTQDFFHTSDNNIYATSDDGIP